MGTVISTTQDVFKTIWQLHFRIPEPLYWLTIVVAGIGFSTASPAEAVAWTALFALGLQGVVRWHYHRGRGRRALVLAQFAAPGDAQGRAAEVQQLFLTQLRDKLSPSDARQVHAVPAVVGTADAEAAARLRRRLRARLLIYGRVTTHADGWAVFARTLVPVGGGTHFDEHTRDRTPIKRSWGERVDLLSPTERVLAEEYPMTAATEIESILRGSAGQVALFLGEVDSARELLEDALELVAGSTSAAADGLRVAAAEAMLEQDDFESAIDLLRARAQSGTASPELLRMLNRVLWAAAAQGIEDAYEARAESLAALREAVRHDADPQRDMSQFNLAAILGASADEDERAEGIELLLELEQSSNWYSRAWYVQRLLGSAAWSAARRAEATGDPDAARDHYSEAGRRYGKAIRLRPRIGFFVWQGPRRVLWTVYPAAPILRSNLADVHDVLQRRLRAKWQWWRCERARDKLIRRGLKRFAEGNWEFAYANFDWVITGRGDFRDVVALVYRSVAAFQYGDDEEALVGWQQALAWHPYALLTRAAILRDPESHPVVRGVPGDEPTDLDVVADSLGLPAMPPGPLPVGSSGWRARLFPKHEPTGGMP